MSYSFKSKSLGGFVDVEYVYEHAEHGSPSSLEITSAKMDDGEVMLGDEEYAELVYELSVSLRVS